MVEDVQELRLELEADFLLDREALRNRRVVERLVRTVQIEDLPDGPRRGVWQNVGRICRAAGRGRQEFRIDAVHIAAASRAYVVHADGILQVAGRDAVEDDATVSVIVEGPLSTG